MASLSSARDIVQEGGDPVMQFGGGFAARRPEGERAGRRAQKHLRHRAPGSRHGSGLPSGPNSAPSAAHPGSASRRPSASAVCRARRSGLTKTRACSKGGGGSRPRIFARPSSLSGISVWPWMRPCAFHRSGRGAGSAISSNIELHDHRHMIGRFLPAAHLLHDGLGLAARLSGRG